MAILPLGSFNDLPYHAVNHFDAPRIGFGPLIDVLAKIPLTQGESGLSIDQLMKLHEHRALNAQKKGDGLT